MRCLIKVSALNDFYSTNIFSPFQVAKHIINLDIDDRLQVGDVTLVNDIAKVTMDNGKVENFYFFATKYCSHHKPIDLPIYDSYVDKLFFGRLVIKYHKTFKQQGRYYGEICNDLEVQQILPTVFDGDDFPGYDKVGILYIQLESVLNLTKIKLFSF